MDNVKATIPSDNKMIIYTGIAVTKYVNNEIKYSGDPLAFGAGAVYYKYRNPNIHGDSYCEQFKVEDIYKRFHIDKVSEKVETTIEFEVTAYSKLEAKTKIKNALSELIGVGFEVTAVVTLETEARYKVEVKTAYYQYMLGSEYDAKLYYAAYSNTGYRYFEKYYELTPATPVTTIIETFYDNSK